MISLIKHYLDTNLDTSEKILDTFWILFGVPLVTWPPLHLATEVTLPSADSGMFHRPLRASYMWHTLVSVAACNGEYVGPGTVACGTIVIEYPCNP